MPRRSEAPPDQPASRRREPRQQRSQATVSAVLQAAEELFSTRGFARTTSDDIARRAGTGVGSIYDYFPNKAAIAVTLLENRSGALADEARRMFMELASESLEESLPKVIRGLFASYRDNQDVFITLVNDVPELRAIAEIYSIDRLIHRASLIYLQSYEGEIGASRIDQLHEFLTIVFLGSIRQYLSGIGPSLSEDDFLDHLSGIVLTYLKQNRTGKPG